MRLSEKYPEFEPILKGGIPHNQLFELFYLLATVRYATKEQLNSEFPRIATNRKPIRKLTILKDTGYVSETDGVYTATDKTLKLLKSEGFNTDILIDKPTQGKGLAHSLKCTDIILAAKKEPYFFCVIRPYFKYLIPDFAIVYRNEDKAKLVFFEVEETEKPFGYLEDKKEKYEQLSRDPLAYRAWKWWAEKLGLKVCKETEFCFGWRVV